MKTGLYTHADCLLHDTGPGHPECADRLSVILKALDAPEFSGLARMSAPKASEAQIARIHPLSMVAAILQAMPASGHAYLDADTVISPPSGAAAFRAAGAVCAAVDAVAEGNLKNAFCAIRPPGHHAEPGRPMGFCLFNNVAIGAMQARAVHGLERVAVIDFDVHHGNGTEAAFREDPKAFYGSVHQMPLYPGSGAVAMRGVGNIYNAPLPPHAGSAEFRSAMLSHLLAALDGFAPDMVFISAGFDAHVADPLAQLRLTEDDFYWATREIMKVAEKHCAGRVVSVLEGGYNLAALGPSAGIHVRALMRGARQGD